MENFFKSYEQHEQQIKGTIKGILPEWLNGTLLRTGPAKWDLDNNFTLNHYFDGCALIVRFEIDQKNKNVFVNSKFLNSDAYKKMCCVKRPVYTEFGTHAYTDITKSAFSRIFNKLVPSDLTDNDISNIYKIKDEIYMTTESCNVWKIDDKNLNSLLKINLDKNLGITIACSHPLYCEVDKATYNIGSTFLTGVKYHVMKVPDQASKVSSNQNTVFDTSSIICSFNSSFKSSLSYNHSFCITENYIIVIEQSLLINCLKLATCTPKCRSLNECLEWCPDEPSRFHVIDKKTGNLLKTKYQTKGFFYFHCINAYEKDDFIVLDILNYDSPSLFDNLNLDRLREGKWDSSKPSKPNRYVLPLANKKQLEKNVNLVPSELKATAILNSKEIFELTGHQIGSPGFEMPTINSKYVGKPYRYIYGSGFLEKNYHENSVFKIDIFSGDIISFKDSDTTYPGEAIFVAKPNAQQEDDGIILSCVLEADQNKNSYLLILDAKSFEELARVEFDRAQFNIPPTIHGIWLDGEQV